MRCPSVCRRESLSVMTASTSEPSGFAKRLGTSRVERPTAVALEQVPVEVEERRCAIRRRRRAADPVARYARRPAVAHSAGMLERASEKPELRPAAADRALALAQAREAVGEVRLHRVERRVVVLAVQLVRVAGELVELLLAGRVLRVEPVRRADACVCRSLEQDVAARLQELVFRERAAASGRPSRGPAALRPPATIVGARSMFATNCERCCPAGSPGPRMISGTRIDGS